MPLKSSPRLFIGGLKRNVEKEEMTAEFTEFGEIVDIWIAYDPPGFAFIEFSTESAARAALEAKHKSQVFDCEIRVEFTKKKDDKEPNENKTRLFIGGVVDHIEKEDIITKFEKFGNITDVWIAHNPPGFAFLEFDNDESANKSVSEMDGSKLFGGTVRVQITKGRKEGRRNRMADKLRSTTTHGRRGDEFRHAGDYRSAPYPPQGDAYGRRRGPPPYPAREPYYPREHAARDPYPARGPPRDKYPGPSHHEPTPSHHGPPPSHHGHPPAHHGHPAAHHGPPPAHHGPPPAHHGPPPAHHGPPPAYHDPYGHPPPAAHHEPPHYQTPPYTAPRDPAPRDPYPAREPYPARDPHYNAPPRDPYYSSAPNPYTTAPRDPYTAPRDPYYAPREYPPADSVAARPPPPTAGPPPRRDAGHYYPQPDPYSRPYY